MSSRESSRVTGRDKVGRPKTTTRSISSASVEDSSNRYVDSAAPQRALLDGSAKSGTAASAARSATAAPMSGRQSPATITVWVPSERAVGSASALDEVITNSGAGGGQADSAGTSGSLNSTFNCTGPGIRVRDPMAAVIIRAISKRQVR